MLYLPNNNIGKVQILNTLINVKMSVINKIRLYTFRNCPIHNYLRNSINLNQFSEPRLSANAL